MSEKSPIWIGTSWKMNKTSAEAKIFSDGLRNTPADPRFQRFIIPPFTYLREVKQWLRETDVKVGAQNMHWADEGAWTGEVSVKMLTDCHLDIVELGHSERRAYFGETDETVSLKVEAAIRHGLTPLICIGETLAEKDAGHADQVLRTQVEIAFSKLSENQKKAPILLAYEPVWAIGANGVPAEPQYADARQAQISKIAEQLLGQKIPCLYGGSVNPNNCEELIACDNIDGLFIGRSAWNVEGYLDILARCATAI